ncbi:hypothetical protein CRYUN_Cryun35bG0084400 [Craigia yunnanensis]
MVNSLFSSKTVACLVSSIILNQLFIINIYVGGQWKNLSWSSRAAAEAEAVAAISCSGHGRAYLDGLVVDGNKPVCECNICYTGPDCSQFIPDCTANADEKLMINFNPAPSLDSDLLFSFFSLLCLEGDAYAWRNRSDAASANMIEFVTSPNNPDGRLKKAILHGPHVKTVYDRAYYWPHFTPIPAPADEDVMVFTLSKLTGHAGSRFGWAVIKDETVYNRMVIHMNLNSMGVSRDTQLRAFKLLKTVLEGEGEGKEIFDFAYQTMKTRWERLSKALSFSNRFSLQKINPQYCTFYNKVREFSTAYAWLKCERRRYRLLCSSPGSQYHWP